MTVLTGDPAQTTSLDQLAATLRGPLLLPGSSEYARLATPWNRAVAARPIAVAAAVDADDVAAAVRWANEHRVRVAVRLTGHGAVDALDGALLIHTGALDELAIGADGVARIGAGLTWAPVIEAAAPLGLAPVAGSAPHVGVVGFLTGGGLGPLARSYGVSSDAVRGIEIVTGDGVLRRADETNNAGLFWGVRGGKGSLGIVTAVEVQLVHLPTLLGGALFFDGVHAATVLHRWAEWCRTLPESATTSIAINRLPAAPGVPEPLAGRTTIAVRFAWTGDPADGEAALGPIASVAPVVFGGVGVMPSAAIGMIHADPVDPMPTQERATMLRALPADAVEALLALTGGDADCPQVVIELRQLGGAVGRTAAPDAFSGRDTEFTLLTIGIDAGPVAAPTRVHAAAVATAMAPWSTGRQLPNFAPSADPEQAALVYDSGTLARLGSLIAAYDPNAVVIAAEPIREACMRLPD